MDIQIPNMNKYENGTNHNFESIKNQLLDLVKAK